MFTEICERELFHFFLYYPRELSELTKVILKRYYEGGVSSVYLWDTDEGGFAGVVLIKKSELPSPSFISYETHFFLS